MAHKDVADTEETDPSARKGRQAGSVNFEPTGEAYLRVFTVCQKPECRFGDGKPVMSRVAEETDIPVKWVKRAWNAGWKGDCVEEVTWVPLSTRLFNAQVKARAKVEDDQTAKAEAARKEKDKAEAQAAKTMTEELKLATAIRQNAMALTQVYQIMLEPLFNGAKTLAARFASEDLSSLSPTELLDRTLKMAALGKGLSTLAHEAMALERRRVGRPELVIGSVGMNAPGSPASYPESVEEAMEYVAVANRAFKRAAEKGLVPVGRDTPVEVIDIVRQGIVDMMVPQTQSAYVEEDDEQWIEEEDDGTDSDNG